VKELSPELIGILNFLLPGFVARWVFHGLTAFKRSEAFERVIEALIFTAIVQGILPPLRDACRFVTTELGWWQWSDKYTLAYSIIVALVVGFLAAGVANNDVIHRWLRNRHIWFLRHSDAEKWRLRDWRWTKRTSMPTQWFSTFYQQGAWIVLHLDDDTFLYGFALEWPDHPDDGHFVIGMAEWVDENKREPIENTEAILISAKNVKMVQFAQIPKESEGPGWLTRLLSRRPKPVESTPLETASTDSQEANPVVQASSTVAVDNPQNQRRKNGRGKKS